ncbi:Outer membrane protein beta-barrel domain-containing protein [Chryseobacterium oleae]|uniref:Outer membrane protein beta-barrel domain-containing protein n=1 Tax=Chryseobacterium oleae TaxID=491207 RepID=A0A1I4YC14_CHROL|nr:porin family protein [Chryseobacterium oleae]SFN35598.1 Outer membrane protein beta-barrel domain-containing protein [Chryseobacterium oleae]
MKKLILGLAFAGSLLVNAQEKTKSTSPITFGVKAGFNASTLSKYDGYDGYDNDQKLKPGFNAGVFVNIPVAEKFSVQPEVLFSQLGSKTEEKEVYYNNSDKFKRETDYKKTLNYLTIPVMVQYNILPQLYVEAGPEFGFLLGGKDKGDLTLTQTSGNTTTTQTTSFSENIVKDLHNKFNFGIGIGAGYYFTQNFGVTARFTAGITDIYKHNNGDAVRNNAFQVGVAYKFK